MNQNGGFGNDDYDVMNKSCNTFTAALSKRYFRYFKIITNRYYNLKIALII